MLYFIRESGPAGPTAASTVRINLSFGKFGHTINVRDFRDMTEIIPQLITKLAFTDFEAYVDGIVVTERNFFQLILADCTVVVESLSLPFSDYKEMAQVEEYAQISGLEEGLQLPDPFSIPVDSSVPANVVQELEARLEVFDLSETTECIMREFIGPILVGAIRLLGSKSGVKIRSEHKVTGKRGRGPLNYDLLFHLFHIIVCEAKNGKDVVDGIPQNTAQLVACREVSIKDQRKTRKRDDPGELEAALEQIPSFGIVSTGRSWIFLKYYKCAEDDCWKLERSVEYHLPLTARSEDRTGLNSAVVTLLEVVTGILRAQRDEVLAFEARMSSKRSRATSGAST